MLTKTDNFILAPEWFLSPSAKMAKWPVLGVLNSAAAATTSAVRLVISVALAVFALLMQPIACCLKKESRSFRMVDRLTQYSLFLLTSSISTLVYSCLNAASLGFLHRRSSIFQPNSVMKKYLLALKGKNTPLPLPPLLDYDKTTESLPLLAPEWLLKRNIAKWPITGVITSIGVLLATTIRLVVGVAALFIFLPLTAVVGPSMEEMEKKEPRQLKKSQFGFASAATMAIGLSITTLFYTILNITSLGILNRKPPPYFNSTAQPIIKTFSSPDSKGDEESPRPS